MGNICCDLIKDSSSSSICQFNQDQKIQSDTKSVGHYEQNSLNGILKIEKENIKPIEKKRIKSSQRARSNSPSLKDKIKSEQQLDDKLYLILIGSAGVGKTRLIQQMKLKKIESLYSRNSFKLDNKSLKNCEFREGILGDQLVIVDTPSFQLDDDIDTREKLIKGFQEYFDNRKLISSFGIVVNFERTDLMKKKVLQVLKYIRKFIGIISIIVVNMELSENQDEDKQHLKNSFKHMGCNKIIFISQKMKKKEILEQIKEIEFKKTQIDLTDTIFESNDIINEHKILNELVKSLNKQQMRS